MAAGRKPRTLRKTTQLLAVSADGRVMQLSAWEFDALRMSPVTKVGRGICSSTDCENRAVFLTKRGRRWWGLCTDHAQLYAADQTYWSPGMEQAYEHREGKAD